jgi:hypothetical protein
VTADGGTTPKVHDGWMWDLTVPGNNDHDFYVLPAQVASQRIDDVLADNVPILVHNNCDLHDLARAQSAVSKTNNTAGAVARDTYTGEWAYGESGTTPQIVHPQLQERLNLLLEQHGGSLEEWPAGECAEFNACNNLLLQQPGVRLDEIEYATIFRETGENFPSCDNCRFLLRGGGAREAEG